MKIYLIFLLLLILNGCTFNNQIKLACFGENCLKVEIADTDIERETGLMNRNSLDRDRGMLFVFEKEDIYGFWMKDTLISLDMIWITENNEVVFIKENAKPCNENCEIFIPDKNAKYVLEINSGIAKELDIKEGDKVSFK